MKAAKAAFNRGDYDEAIAQGRRALAEDAGDTSAKTVIENALSAPVDTFAYPFGRYDERCREIVRQNFSLACSDELGVIKASSDRYALERVDASYLRRDRLFDILLTLMFPWYIWARGIPRRIRPDVPSVST